MKIHNMKMISTIVNVKSIICFLLLLSTLLYSGRLIYGFIFVIAFLAILISKKTDKKSLHIVIICSSFYLLHIFFFMWKDLNLTNAINPIILYIPVILYFVKDGIFPGFYSFEKCICIISLFINITYLYQYVFFGYSRTAVTILGASINYLATINCFFLCFFLYCLSVKSKRGIIFYIAFGITVSNILISLSRSSLVMAVLSVVAWIFFTFLQSNKHNKAKILLKSIVIIFIGILVMSRIYLYIYENNASFRNSMDSFLFYFQRISTVGLGESRTILWENAKKIISDNILLGVGDATVLSSMNEKLAAHNFVLEILLLSGVSGLIIYFFSYLVIISHSILGKSIEKKFFLGMLCVEYWGVNLVQPFISTGYFLNTLFGLMLIAISMSREKG